MPSTLTPSGGDGGADRTESKAEVQPAAHERAITAKTVSGMAWTMSMSWATRAVQVLGTLALTHFLLPQVIGEVANAAILTMSADRFSRLGVSQFLVTRRNPSREMAWHATLILGATGLFALALVLLSTTPLGHVLQSPTLGRYLPGLAVAAMLTRLGVIPERLLQAQLRFRSVSTARGTSEVAYTVVAVALAALGWGGQAIVLANVVRAALYLLLMGRSLSWGEWMRPQPYSPAMTRSIFAFGLPLSVAGIFGFAVRNWDNLLVSSIFGTAVVGAYNLAYNLANIPAVQLGEHIGDVLTPALTHLEPEQRTRTLLRWLGVLSVVVFPFAVGLGVVAPTLVATVLRPQWAEVGPMLVILSCIGVLRPIGWIISSYLQTVQRSETLMWVSILQAVVLFTAMAVLGHFLGPLWACAGVGVGFGVAALAFGWVVVRTDGVRWAELARACVPALLACVPMVGAVLAVRAALAATGPLLPGAGLALEVLAGAVAYTGAVLLVARPTLADIRQLVGDFWHRRSAARAASRAVAAQ